MWILTSCSHMWFKQMKHGRTLSLKSIWEIRCLIKTVGNSCVKHAQMSVAIEVNKASKAHWHRGPGHLQQPIWMKTSSKIYVNFSRLQIFSRTQSFDSRWNNQEIESCEPSAKNQIRVKSRELVIGFAFYCFYKDFKLWLGMKLNGFISQLDVFRLAWSVHQTLTVNQKLTHIQRLNDSRGVQWENNKTVSNESLAINLIGAQIFAVGNVA